VVRVYVSVGSNIDRDHNIATALRLLQASFGELQRSSVYESEAVGFDSDPFYNLVVGFDTRHTPREIQDVLHCIEEASGRIRTTGLSARTLDLDLLLADKASPGTLGQRESDRICYVTMGLLRECLFCAVVQEHDIEETSCRATGQDACEFKITIGG